MELRGDVRRGYFVLGLAGAQFALPAAVEQLRAASSPEPEAPVVVLAASDPANVWNLPLSSEPGASPDTFARPRGARSLVVTRSGRVVVTADAAASAVAVRPDVDRDIATAAVRALIKHVAARRARDVIVETINGESAATSAQAETFTAAGLRLTTAGLRYYASFDRD